MHVGSSNPVRRSRLESRRRYDEVRRSSEPWRKWYKREPWTSIRRIQLIEHPLCAWCSRRGLVVVAKVVDHEEPHRGDWGKFVTGPFLSLCKSCHDRKTRAEETGQNVEEVAASNEVDPATGIPLDPAHPWHHKG